MATAKTPKAKAAGRPASTSGGKSSVARSQRQKVRMKPGRPTKQVSAAVELLKAASGDPLRLRILCLLLDEEQTLAAICNSLHATRPLIAAHVTLLRQGGLLQVQRVGQQNAYSLNARSRAFVRCLNDTYPLTTKTKTPAENIRQKRLKAQHTSVVAPIDRSLLKDVGAFVDDPQRWFETPNSEFEGQRPIDMLGTDQERRLRYRINAAKIGAFS
jgi:DNA-binding transcriptional ArsR family regulator